MGIVIIVMLILVVIIYSGTLWGKAIARKEIAQYLKDKYSRGMLVENVYYNFKRSGYNANVYCEEENVGFIVEPCSKVSGYKYKDCYYSSVWQKEIASEIRKDVKISDNTEIYVSMLRYFTEYENKPTIPYYTDALEKIERINIFLYNNIDETIDYAQLLEIISLLKTKKIYYHNIYLCYGDNAKTRKEIGITREDAEKIIGVDDIKRLINTK